MDDKTTHGHGSERLARLLGIALDPRQDDQDVDSLQATASLLREVDSAKRPVERPACLVLGGETTVTVNGGGKGGRNQELALSAAIETRGMNDVVVVSLATDGNDGPTDAAGAVATGETASQAAALGLDPVVFLNENDSYRFFDALGDLISTGPTLTNVGDLVFLFAF